MRRGGTGKESHHTWPLSRAAIKSSAVRIIIKTHATRVESQSGLGTTERASSVVGRPGSSCKKRFVKAGRVQRGRRWLSLRLWPATARARPLWATCVSFFRRECAGVGRAWPQPVLVAQQISPGPGQRIGPATVGRRQSELYSAQEVSERSAMLDGSKKAGSSAFLRLFPSAWARTGDVGSGEPWPRAALSPSSPLPVGAGLACTGRALVIWLWRELGRDATIHAEELEL